MELWSGRAHVSRVRASPPHTVDTGDSFALTFFKSKDPQPPQPKQDQQYPSDSASTGSVSGKLATPCKVCGDKASGYHYGVTSCEGCKGFFRRSIQKQIEYRCLRDGKCLVIRLNRNRCQFCRFKKCLAVGMSRDSVRYGRVPKRPREPLGSDNMPDLAAKNLTATSMLPAPVLEHVPEPEPLRHDITKDLVKAVTAAHKTHNAYTDDVKKTLQHRTIMMKVEDSDNEGSGGEEAASSTTDRATDVRSVLWYNVALRMTPAVQHVVEFAKKLPGFNTLPQDDQLILIKLGFFEVWLSRISRLSTPDCIVFDDGTAISQSQLVIIYDPSFAAAMLNYVWTLIKLQVTEEEMAMYTSVLLLCPQRASLSDPERINSLHRAVSDAFQYTVMSNGSGAEGATAARARLETFTVARQEVRALGARHNHLLSWCREHWPRLLLPALFSEIFDIPKSEEDENGDSERGSGPATHVA